MKIDTTKPRLQINRPDRLKHPLKPIENDPDEQQNLLLGDKEGEELDKVVRRLYERNIEK